MHGRDDKIKFSFEFVLGTGWRENEFTNCDTQQTPCAKCSQYFNGLYHFEFQVRNI